jgi:predicted membrane chloride channel (bestrophin family)
MSGVRMYLSAYLADLIRRGQLNTSFIGPFHTSLAALHQSLSDLDKIATTPIPSAYSFHLRFAVWAYLFFLPFQIFPTLGWLTIPATAIASVTYLGFLEIGAQIEMPFAYDQSDLDLDRYVMKIVHQLAEVTAVSRAYTEFANGGHG